ncbi:hypothetical protein QQF64_023164 [Cirrhinus molitorella]|uniref:Uncharacterized protein n=1 Tax=Cirrhinus molitorella TaxID=172907 RepID=A0ABR3L8B8_9TELE
MEFSGMGKGKQTAYDGLATEARRELERQELMHQKRVALETNKIIKEQQEKERHLFAVLLWGPMEKRLENWRFPGDLTLATTDHDNINLKEVDQSSALTSAKSNYIHSRLYHTFSHRPLSPRTQLPMQPSLHQPQGYPLPQKVIVDHSLPPHNSPSVVCSSQPPPLPPLPPSLTDLELLSPSSIRQSVLLHQITKEANRFALSLCLPN